MDATSIKQLIQQLVKGEMDMPTIVMGAVTDIDPLRITLVNDLNINLSAISLTIPARLKPINQGEQFYMLATNNGKSYYLLDRV